ncbi:MAG: hypothetical protein EAX95_12580 [Candidatus Thorarchaeota archaeon]|nr:hypothetical protein [Candidatus Thorarchaeota archaeon]
MSAEAEVNNEANWRWCEGIPPLDPVDPRHSLSLLLIAEAREGQRSSKKPASTALPRKSDKKEPPNH